MDYRTEQKDLARERDNNTCQNPRCKIFGKDNKLPVHHIFPIKTGGSDELDNLITLCPRCHGVIERKKERYDFNENLRL